MSRKSAHQVSPQSRHEASEWFIAFREGETDAPTCEAFYAWLRRSPENVHAYLRITALWEDAELLTKSDLFDRDALLRRAREETNVVAFESPPASAKRGAPELRDTEASRDPAPHRNAGAVRRKLAIAASILIVIAGAITWFQQHKDTFATDVGEQRTVTLADGSAIVLNARSRVRVRFTQSERNIDLLEGQAIFRVAHNRTRPFIVHTGSANVRAVGTQFDVYRKENGTTVTVIEGRVAVLPQTAEDQNQTGAHRDMRQRTPRSSSSPKTPATPDSGTANPATAAVENGEVFLTAGEQVTLSPNAYAVPRRADIETATAWTQGKLIFDATPLSEVVQEFNRYSSRRLVIEDAGLSEFHVSGVFPSSDPSRVAELLRRRFGVTIRESDDEIRIVRQ
jgi:transmembrane sensor